MKKILIVSNHSYMLWQFRRELIQALMEKYNVVISTPFVGHEEDFREMGCTMIETKVDRRGINPVTDYHLLKIYGHIIKNEKPDLVLTYSIKPNIYAGLICTRNRIPYCINVQGLGTAFQRPGLAQAVTILYKVALKKAKKVFFENEGNAQIFRDKHITPETQQMILSGAGVNLIYHHPENRPENEKVRFLYLGRIMKEKGIDELFYAVKKLRENKKSFILDLVGFFEDKYKEQVKELEELGVVQFHGFQSDPRPYYQAADCVVLPSYHEGMSNVLLEAAATSRPIITSDIPGCREAVENGISGYLCPAQDKEAIYQAMERFLNLTSKERDEMGKAGRMLMEKNFDKEEVVGKTISVIDRYM